MASQISILIEFFDFLTFLTLGAFLAFIYDIFRSARFIFKHPNWLVGLEDILYWIFCTIFVFYIILRINYGNIRWYIIIAIFSGSLIYFYSISKFIKNLIIKFIKILLYPFKVIFNFLKYIKRGKNGKKNNRHSKRKGKRNKR